MKINFTVDCLGYCVGGFNNKFEMEIEEWEIEDMNEEEIEEYIHKQCLQYVADRLEIEIE